MVITKDEILKRKEQLQAEYQQAIGTVQAINGALQDCDYWLKLLEEQERGNPAPLDES